MTPPSGAQIKDRYCMFETAIGPCGIAWHEQGVTRLQLPERDQAATERRLRSRSEGPCPPPAVVARAIGELRRYFAGEKTDLSLVPIDLAGKDQFDLEVYEAARGIGWGSTATYGELATQAGHSGMAREVGQAMARNPVPIVIPCHRVLASGNRIGGFSAYGGTLTKERLLALEGVHLRDPDLFSAR